jgi:predicted dehydrogenase
MAEKVTLGFIGCGGMAGAHVAGLKILWDAGLRDFEVVATCDIEQAKAQQFSDDIAEWQGTTPRVYADYEVMLKNESDMMAVDIVTLHRNHHIITNACFEAGKHVTIEKPIAITLRAGKKMLDDNAKAGTVFQVAENYRRDEPSRAIKWAVTSGLIGDLRQIYWMDVEERLWYWTWRDHVMQAGGGWPLDGGVHFADLFTYHVGYPETIYSAVRTYNPKRYTDPENMQGPIDVDVEDTTLAILTFPNGVVGQWTYSLAAPGTKFSQRVLYGDDGSIDFHNGYKSRKEEWTMEQLVARHHEAIGPDEMEKLFPRGIKDTIATELHEFFQAVLTGGTVEVDGLQGFRAEAISISLYESQELGRPVTLKEMENLELETYQNRINDGLEGL